MAATDVESMSNEEIREALLKYGEKIGPVIDSTRALYKRKLIALRSSTPGNIPTPKNAGTAPYAKSVPPPGGYGVPEQTRVKGDPVVIAKVSGMSNEGIRSALKEFGKDSGPIVASTRRTYERKLIKLQTRQIRTAAGDLSDEFSSDDEDMDWCN